MMKKAEVVGKLSNMETTLRQVLHDSFTNCILSIQRLTWSTSSGALLEFAMSHEAVHPMNSLDQVKQRLGTARRCFGLFHPMLPNQPIAIVYVALMRTFPESISVINSAPSVQKTGHTGRSRTERRQRRARSKCSRILLHLQLLFWYRPSLHGCRSFRACGD